MNTIIRCLLLTLFLSACAAPSDNLRLRSTSYRVVCDHESTRVCESFGKTDRSARECTCARNVHVIYQ